MSNHDEKDLLTRELHQRSAGVGGHPIGLDDVRDRARSIRRRRNAVRGVVAAVVLAVAVPVGLSATDLLGSSGTPAPPVASRTPRAVAGHARTHPGAGRVVPADRERPGPGRARRRALHRRASRDQLVTPDGTFDLPESYSMITPYNGGWLAIGSSQHPGQIIMLDDNLEVTHTDPAGGYDAGGQPRRLPRRLRGAARARTQVMLVNAPTDGTDPVTWMIDVPGGESLDPVGFLDNDSVVYYSDGGRRDGGRPHRRHD